MGGMSPIEECSLMVVPPVDPDERCELELFDGLPGRVEVDAFGLVEPDRGLGERVVVGVADEPIEASAPASASLVV